jgi:hypothetical protein
MSTIDPDLGDRVVAIAIAFRDRRERLVLQAKGGERSPGRALGGLVTLVKKGQHSDPTAETAVANLEVAEDAARELRELDEAGLLFVYVFSDLVRFPDSTPSRSASEAGSCAHHWERLQVLVPRDGRSLLCSFCRHWKQEHKALPCDRVLEAQTLYPERRLTKTLVEELENTTVPVRSVMARELLSAEESRARVGQRDPAAAWLHAPARSQDLLLKLKARNWTRDPQ